MICNRTNQKCEPHAKQCRPCREILTPGQKRVEGFKDIAAFAVMACICFAAALILIIVKWEGVVMALETIREFLTWEKLKALSVFLVFIPIMYKMVVVSSKGER